MTAWSILTGNSTAPIGSTAWVHLNNQQGGGGSGTIIVDNYEVDLEMLVAVEVHETIISAHVEDQISVALDLSAIKVEID